MMCHERGKKKISQLRGSVVRASSRYLGGHGFISCRGFRFLSLSLTLVTNGHFVFNTFVNVSSISLVPRSPTIQRGVDNSSPRRMESGYKISSYVQSAYDNQI